MKWSIKIPVIIWQVDVNSLFINILLDETIDLCVNELFPESNSISNGFNETEFHKVQSSSKTESFFMLL